MKFIVALVDPAIDGIVTILIVNYFVLPWEQKYTHVYIYKAGKVTSNYFNIIRK